MQDKWQPIETAPRDGTRILGWVNEAEWAAICWWETAPIELRYAPQEQWQMSEASDFPDDEAWYEHWRDTRYEPTHWMPLPAPPEPTT